MKKLNLNASTVTDLRRITSPSLDCIYAKVNIDGVTVDVTYETISKQVVIHRGFLLDRDTCDALIASIPAYLDSIAA